MSARVTVGIDIGTSSVKAVAADDDGNVVRRSRVPHEFFVPSPTRFEHDAQVAWADGTRVAFDVLGDDLDVRGVSIAAMVPSLTAVGDDGRAIGPGLLYGDDRGGGKAAGSGEMVRFLDWLAHEYPHAAAFAPAQALGNFALGGESVLSTTAAAASYPLLDFATGGWSEELVRGAGAQPEQLPRLVPQGWVAGEVRDRPGCVIEGGTIDVMGEQLVAGANDAGDVIVICGTTLIVWQVTDDPVEIAGSFPMPHTVPGKWLVGGASNAGGLFLNWASELLAPTAARDTLDPANVPLWVPYPRGERAIVDDSDRRAELRGLDLTHGPTALRRAVFESAGFVARLLLDASDAPAWRIVATGGGVRVREWVETLAYCTGLPVDIVDVPEGGALGAAFLARVAAGLETNAADAARWARAGERIEPDDRWAAAAADRYAEWREVSA